LGHFFFAKLFKVNVKEFSIGIGPSVLQRKTKKGMKITLRILPLMAYVSMDSYKIRAIYKDEKDSEKKR
jgi:membrane-associated protease RseP (regulator of RpoE activity)